MTNPHEDALIAALMEDGVEPTDEAIAKLESYIQLLAELLVETYVYSEGKERTMERARRWFAGRFREIINQRIRQLENRKS